MKARIIAIIVMLLLGMLCPFQLALAGDLFYSGDIIIDSIIMSIEADEEATINAVYILTNRSEHSEEVDLQFSQSPVPLEVNGEELGNPVLFKPYEQKSVSLTCSLNITGETTKTLSLDPTMLFDGKPNSEPAKALLIKVLLPQGISGLAWANQEPNEEGFDDGRKFYSWDSANIYPTILRLKWSTLQVELSVEKSVTPREITTPNQIINIEINLHNRGDKAINEISLTDKYITFEFAPVYPWWDFGEQEPWLIWRNDIRLLEPGETRTLTYSVRYVGLSSQSYDMDLKPCVVTVAGHLVAVSNKLRINQSGEVVPAPADSDILTESEAEQLHYFPSVPLLGGIIFVLLVVRLGYTRWKYKH